MNGAATPRAGVMPIELSALSSAFARRLYEAPLISRAAFYNTTRFAIDEAPG